MWLTQTMRDVLKLMAAAEDRGDTGGAEIVCDRGTCFLGYRRIHRATVHRLLKVTAVRSESDAAFDRYRINDMGRAILRRPQVIQDLSAALRNGGSYTLRGDRIVMLDNPGE